MSEPNQALMERSVDYVTLDTKRRISLNIGMVRKYVAAPAFDRQTKAEIQISDKEAVQFMMLCQARQLDVWEGDAFAVPFWDGRTGNHKWALITSHNAFLKRGEINPSFEGMESGVLVDVEGNIKALEGDFVPDSLSGEKVKLVGGWAKVYRKDRKFPTHRRLKLSTFQKDFGQWMKDPAGMIVKCAEADALRSAFPSSCGSMYLREEMPTVDVQASSQPVEERRPDFGQRAIGPTPRAKGKQTQPAETTQKTPQDAPEKEPATSTPPEPESASDKEPAGETQGLDPSPATSESPEPTDQGETGENTPDNDSHTTEKQESEPEEELPPFKPNPNEGEALQSVRLMMHRGRVTEAQVMTWAKANKLAKESQSKLAELANSKIENINASWANILPKIKAAAQQ